MAKMIALVLEDSQTQANIITRLLESQGWRTLHCLTPNEAVDTLKTVNVQALFLDVFVGVYNTIGMLPQFRRLAPDAPLVVMTAGSNKGNLEATLHSARLANADYVLRKPFGEAQIRNILLSAFKDVSTFARRKHVLIIDDSGPIRALTKSAYENAGYRASVAIHMEDAFKNIDIAHVDVVLCDVFMPGMGGLKGMSRIRKTWPNVKIIAMSAGVESFVSEEEALTATRELGAHAQLRKPFTSDSLLEVTDMVVNVPPLIV